MKKCVKGSRNVNQNTKVIYIFSMDKNSRIWKTYGLRRQLPDNDCKQSKVGLANNFTSPRTFTNTFLRLRDTFLVKPNLLRLLHCVEPAISLHSHHVSLVQWTNPLLPVTRDLGSNPLGGLMWNRDSPVATLVTPTWSDHWLRHPQGASLGSAPTMCKPRSTWSHSFPFSVSHLLQVSLLASQLTESAAGGEPFGEPAISLHSHHVSLTQWTNPLLPVSRDLGSNPLGDLCETGILLLALSRHNTIKIPANFPEQRVVLQSSDNSSKQIFYFNYSLVG
jgi:hypothetical protein